MIPMLVEDFACVRQWNQWESSEKRQHLLQGTCYTASSKRMRRQPSLKPLSRESRSGTLVYHVRTWPHAVNSKLLTPHANNSSGRKFGRAVVSTMEEGEKSCSEWGVQKSVIIDLSILFPNLLKTSIDRTLFTSIKLPVCAMWYILNTWYPISKI